MPPKTLEIKATVEMYRARRGRARIIGIIIISVGNGKNELPKNDTKIRVARA